MRIRAISLDLDDTLWPIAPVMSRAEQRLDAWLKTHCPRVAEEYPITAMRSLRDRIAGEHPHLAHDFTAQRRLSLNAALLPHGYGDEHVDAAFSEFYAARNEVEFYADAIPGLQRLAARYPLVSLSNGNADLAQIGLAHFFQFSISARDFGAAKPATQIFHAVCERLDLPPESVLHVGDDPELDVRGAHAAGMPSVWINRTESDWQNLLASDVRTPAMIRPDIIVRDLLELADVLDAQAVNHGQGSALA
jgi:FMN hydrolase / 5-amino-6-(5-phospho-D-ribitylamino)uracil phosphatase